MGFTGNSKCKKHFFDAVQNKAIILENVGKKIPKKGSFIQDGIK